MRALVIGASGLVGSALMRALGGDAVGTHRMRPRPGTQYLEARDVNAVGRAADAAHTETIFVPAGEPNVEWCELHPAEAREANLAPTRAAVAAASGRRVVGFSSDYVFDGRDGPYREDAERAPLSVYGRIKVELEDLLLANGHAVVRTTTVFGREAGPPKDFVLRLIASLRAGERVRVPYDQISTPTFADDLAAATVRAISRDAGLWHIAGTELMPRTELARRVCVAFDLPEPLIEAVPTAGLGQVAQRPLRGGLLCRRYEALFGSPTRTVDESLAALRSQLEAG